MRPKTTPDGGCPFRKTAFILSGLSLAGMTLALSQSVLARGKDPIEVHRAELIHFQAMTRANIEELLGRGQYARCCRAMLAAYDRFAGSLPSLHGANSDQFYHSAPFMLSLYQALRGEFNLDQPAALEILLQVTNAKVARDYAAQPITRFFLAHVVDSRLVRRISSKKFEYPAEPYGWAAEFPPSDAVIAVNLTHCGLVDWFREQGALEIAPVACQGDYVVAGFMRGMRLERTQTLAQGDPYCDFRYVNAGSIIPV